MEGRRECNANNKQIWWWCSLLPLLLGAHLRRMGRPTGPPGWAESPLGVAQGAVPHLLTYLQGGGFGASEAHTRVAAA